MLKCKGLRNWIGTTMGIMLLAAMPAQAEAIWEKTKFPDSLNVNTMIEGKGGFIFVGTTQTGLKQASGGEASWSEVNTKFGTGGRVASLSGDTTGRIYMTNGQDICGTVDNGRTWFSMKRPSSLATIRAIGYSSGTVYAGGDGGVCQSVTNGADWDHYSLGGETVNVIYPLSSDFIFLGCAAKDGALGGVYRADPVSTWSFINLQNASISSMGFKDSFMFAGVANSFRGGELVGGEEYGSMNWYDYSKGLPTDTIFSIVTASKGTILVAVNMGVYQSNDGLVWQRGGLDSVKVRALLVHSDGYVYAGTSGKGIYRFLDKTLSIQTDKNPPIKHDIQSKILFGHSMLLLNFQGRPYDFRGKFLHSGSPSQFPIDE